MSAMQWEDALSSFKAKLASGQDVFGPLIKKYLLANGHRVTVELLPDQQVGGGGGVCASERCISTAGVG